MRIVLVMTALIGLGGCGSADRSTAENADAGPALNVTAAPGVAFNYRYAFRLPNARIAAVQEEHAQACERLGVARCRITGLRYRLDDEEHVSAMLAFKLDPGLARRFGKDGIAAVQGAEGMLVDSEISGTDVGSSISQADKTKSQLGEELRQIETDTAKTPSTAADRARREARAAELRDQLRTIEVGRAAQLTSLASTPMVFEYGAGGTIPGFDGQSPLKDALKTAVASFVTMLSFIIIAIGALAPWVLAVAALLFLARSRIGRRIRAWLPPRTDSAGTD